MSNYVLFWCIIRIVLDVFAIFILLSIIGLVVYHTMITSNNRTTNEQIRGVFEHRENEWDQGCWANWVYSLCSPVTPSQLPDFTELVPIESARMRPPYLGGRHPRAAAGGTTITTTATATATAATTISIASDLPSAAPASNDHLEIGIDDNSVSDESTDND
jgi:hypothetical protein